MVPCGWGYEGPEVKGKVPHVDIMWKYHWVAGSSWMEAAGAYSRCWWCCSAAVGGVAVRQLLGGVAVQQMHGI